VSGETDRTPAEGETCQAPADGLTGRSTPADGGRVSAALRATARIGPFFVLETGVGLAGQGWLPATEWYQAGLGDLLAETVRRLGSREPRVTASIAQLGFAARLWSPVLGCALAHGIVPDLASLLVSAQPPVRLAVSRTAGWVATTADQVATLSRLVVGNHLGGFAAALPVQSAAGLLRGNSASAMVGALGVLAGAEPALHDKAMATARALLSAGERRGTGTLGAALPAFRRRSCCLYYRLPGGGLCGDCCLAGRRDGWP
jgi:hypothetical protein